MTRPIKNSLAPRGKRRVHNQHLVRDLIAPALGLDPDALYDSTRFNFSTTTSESILLVDLGGDAVVADVYRPDASPNNGVPWIYAIQLTDKRRTHSNRVAVYQLPPYGYTIKLLVEEYGVGTTDKTVPTNVMKRFGREHGQLLGIVDLGFAVA